LFPIEKLVDVSNQLVFKHGSDSEQTRPPAAFPRRALFNIQQKHLILGHFLENFQMRVCSQLLDVTYSILVQSVAPSRPGTASAKLKICEGLQIK